MSLDPGYTYGQDNPFPDPASITIVGNKYRTPHGDFARTTNVLKALGLKAEAIAGWTGRVEKEAAIAAAVEAFAEGSADSVQGFEAMVQGRLKGARAAVREKERAGEIGTAAHEEIRRLTNEMLGKPTAPSFQLGDEVTNVVRSWHDWLAASGITPYLTEQPVYHVPSKTGGTLDLLAYDQAGDLMLYDYKSSTGIYDDHHIQVAHYLRMARQYVAVKAAEIIWLPKKLGDTHFGVVPLGRCYDRTRTDAELCEVFDAANRVYDLMMAA